MASSSGSQEDMKNDFELTSRRSRIRTARAWTVNPWRIVDFRMRIKPVTKEKVVEKFKCGSISEDGEPTEEAFNVPKPADTLNIASCGQGEHDASPKPLSRSKEKRVNRCAPIRQPLTDHINSRTNHLNKGKQQRDRRKLREKRRSTGVVHLQSTESTNGSTGEDEDDVLSASVETKRNTQHNEHVDRDVVEEFTPPKTFQRRNKSPSDLDADDEDNQNQSDSTVSSLVQFAEQKTRPRPGTPGGDTTEELLKRAKEENRRLMSLLEDKEYELNTLEKRIYQLQNENSIEMERLREENATLMRAMAALKSK